MILIKKGLALLTQQCSSYKSMYSIGKFYPFSITLPWGENPDMSQRSLKKISEPPRGKALHLELTLGSLLQTLK